MALDPHFQEELQFREKLVGVQRHLEALTGLLETAVEPEEVAAVEPLLTQIERRVATCRSFANARAAGGDVYLFTPSSDDNAVSHWDDGREVHWDGWRCTVTG